MKARNTIDEILTVVQAAKDGKQIQYWYSQYGLRADDGSWQDCVDSPVLNFADYIYRVKPTVKKVPFTKADIPLDRPVWITSQRILEDKELVIGVSESGVTTHRSWVPFNKMEQCHLTISFDGGKTWQKCEKEVTE